MIYNLVFFVSEGTTIDIRAEVVVPAKSAAFAAAVDAGQHGEALPIALAAIIAHHVLNKCTVLI